MVKKTWAAGKKVAKEMSDAAFKALSNVSDELILYFGLKGDRGNRAQREKERAEANARFASVLRQIERSKQRKIIDFLNQARKKPFRGHITEDKIVFTVGQMEKNEVKESLEEIGTSLEKNEITDLLNWLEILLPDPWTRKVERTLGRFVGQDAASGSQRILDKSQQALGGKDCRLSELLGQAFQEAGIYKGGTK